MKKSKRNLKAGLLFLFTAWTLSACASPTVVTTLTPTIAAPTAIPTVQQTPTRAVPSILTALSDANYPIDVTHTGTAQLKDGFFEEAAAPGSASKITVSLGKNQAEGDLNGDDVPDAAVTLIVDPGGSGTFIYLAAVINNNGAAKPVNSVLLGDRVVVESLSIQSGQIKVNFLDHAGGEPMAATPTLEVVKTFKLEGNQLAEVK